MTTEERLGNDVIIIRPLSSGAPELEEPRLVVLFGWMDAQQKHLMKYADQYKALFPLSTIMVIRSRQSSFYKFKTAQFNSVRPAQAFISQNYPGLHLRPANQSPILVHSFSNGGCLSMMRVNQLLQEHQGGVGIPARAFVFDSCPGTTSLPIFIRAFTAPITSAWLRLPASLVVSVAYVLAQIYNFIRRKPDAIATMSTYLTYNLPLSAPRLYIYSPTDLLIPSPFVERHAKAAESTGVDVQLEKFEKTGHVAHTRGEGNAARYWNSIGDLWKRSGRDL